MPATTSHGVPGDGDAATSAPRNSVPIRRIAYTPTLLSTANNAAAGALEAEYAPGSQKHSGHMPALARNAMPRIGPPTSYSARCATPPPRAVQCEPVGRGEEHFEEYEQVEQVAGEQGTIDAHQQELHQRVEARACALPGRQREHE